MSNKCQHRSRKHCGTRRPHRGFASVVAAVCLVLAASVGAQDAPEPVDLVVVIKSERALYLYRDGLPVKQYDIGLGNQPVGDKFRSGDERTPEGTYKLDWRNPESKFHKSIHVSYPDAKDRRQSAAQDVDPGGQIMIHGQPDYAFEKRTGDWTDGCIAVSNKALDTIWRMVPEDTPIHIYP